MVLNKHTNTQRAVKLSRAPVEYWALYDANAEWTAKYNALRDKSKENEALSFKYKMLSEDLKKTLKSLDATVSIPLETQLCLTRRRLLQRSFWLVPAISGTNSVWIVRCITKAQH